jgi:tetratricopeptide (TPR) repeat protein
LKQVPNDADSLALRSSLLREKGDVAGALAAAKEAVSSNPNSATGQFALGRAHEASREFEPAIAAFNKAAQLDSSFVDVDLELAGLYLAAGQVDSADTWAHSALKKAPESLAAMLAVSAVTLAKRDVEAAEPLIRRLTARLPNEPNVLSKVGQLELLKHNRVAAQAAYEKALDADASNTEALAGFVGIQLQAKRYDPVKRRIEAAVQKAPRNGQLLVVSARAYAVMNDYARAEQLLRSAIEVSPDLIDGYSLLARVLVAEGKADGALKEMENLSARRPDVPGPHVMAGFIYGIQQKTSDAKAAYRRALAIDPNTPLAANNLAYLLAADGESLDEALQLAQLAKQRMPNASDAADTLGWVYFKKGLYRPAVEALREAHMRAPNDVTIQYHLGLALHRSGSPEEARRLLEVALKASPTAPEAAAARQAIALPASGGAR